MVFTILCGGIVGGIMTWFKVDSILSHLTF
jgi:hypothetical protein